MRLATPVRAVGHTATSALKESKCGRVGVPAPDAVDGGHDTCHTSRATAAAHNPYAPAPRRTLHAPPLDREAFTARLNVWPPPTSKPWASLALALALALAPVALCRPFGDAHAQSASGALKLSAIEPLDRRGGGLGLVVPDE